ncbi:Biopolymer transport protein ExbD/TolR [Xanthobacter versatilis]|uniref:Biopolymer transport protein ExbD/TolR n=1 Tax=Xanthobacter autotrophicus (strain ATCC BAA-1158 / Py2) TaxID=78245 RepID=A7IHM9_XANP2|nr:Biopolymer transport protein ExbD/TolR [Xanthobacter autotrophicus Py2]
MDEKPFETMNVIPFVDIMLVLLTMVLTTASFIAVGRIPVSLAQAAPMKVEQQKDTMIEITADGTLHLEGVALSVEELKARLGVLPKDTSILIRADKAVAFQSFVDVADVLKTLAFTKVGVQTKGIAAGAGTAPEGTLP